MFAERLFPAARRNVWRGLRAATRFQPARGSMCVKAVRVCVRALAQAAERLWADTNEHYAGQ